MTKKLSVALAFFFCTLSGNAQFYLEPIAGYALDVNNSNGFKMFNTALQFAYKQNKHSEIFVRLQLCSPLSNHKSVDSSFTTDQSLPLYSPARKTIKPSMFTAAFGNRIRLNGSNKRYVISIMFFGGYSNQKIKVSYEYDRKNYTILNPDKTMEKDGFFLGGGFEYMRIIGNGRLLFQMNISSVPITEQTKNYPNSFHDFMTPIAFNLGYSIPLKTGKHEN